MPFLTNAKLFLAGVLLSVATFFNPSISQSPSLRAVSSFNPVQASPAFLSGAGVSGSQTTVPLTSFVTRQGTPITTANLGGIGYATIDPGTSKEENISFTGVTQNSNGTAILTGVTRGLQDVYPYTASSSLAIAHSGGATVITSNSGAFYSQFNIAANTSTISGNWTFASSSLPSVTSDTPTSSFTTYNFVDKQYADALTFAGAPNGSVSAKGIYQEATQAQMASGTSVGSTGADLVNPTRYSSLTASTSAVSVVAQNTLDPSFLLNGNYNLGSTTAQGLTSASTTFSGNINQSSGTASFASTTITGVLKVNGTVIGSSSFIGEATGTYAGFSSSTPYAASTTITTNFGALPKIIGFSDNFTCAVNNGGSSLAHQDTWGSTVVDSFGTAIGGSTFTDGIVTGSTFAITGITVPANSISCTTAGASTWSQTMTLTISNITSSTFQLNVSSTRSDGGSTSANFNTITWYALK